MSYAKRYQEYHENKAKYTQFSNSLLDFSAQFVRPKESKSDSQLAKTKQSQLNGTPSKELRAGNNNKNTLARTHAGTHAYRNKSHALYHTEIKIFIKLCDQYEPYTVVLNHNADYLNALPNYHERIQFDKLVKAFTKLNKKHRSKDNLGRYLSQEEDYFSAYRLIKCYTPKREIKTSSPMLYKQIWNWLQKNYQEKPFTARDIKRHFQSDPSYIRVNLRRWVKEGKIQHIATTKNRRKTYKIIQYK